MTSNQTYCFSCLSNFISIDMFVLKISSRFFSQKQNYLYEEAIWRLKIIFKKFMKNTNLTCSFRVIKRYSGSTSGWGWRSIWVWCIRVSAHLSLLSLCGVFRDLWSRGVLSTCNENTCGRFETIFGVRLSVPCGGTCCSFSGGRFARTISSIGKENRQTPLIPLSGLIAPVSLIAED